jgi:hypothetical protein
MKSSEVTVGQLEDMVREAFLDTGAAARFQIAETRAGYDPIPDTALIADLPWIN